MTKAIITFKTDPVWMDNYLAEISKMINKVEAGELTEKQAKRKLIRLAKEIKLIKVDG